MIQAGCAVNKTIRMPIDPSKYPPIYPDEHGNLRLAAAYAQCNRDCIYLVGEEIAAFLHMLGPLMGVVSFPDA